ncbi:MAG: hypothetical protein HY293_01445 [Planctomycetes bacterium]|nr:hypothetical protein [Planctomycetota bacterium]
MPSRFAGLLCALLLQAQAALPPEPDAAAQKETLKKVKDLFKEEYAKKLPAEQLAFARKLLQSGIETADDAVSKFVLLKEAREIAVSGGDAEIAIRAADETAKAFAVDGPALKLAVFGKLAIKDPDGARAAARACLALVTDAVGAENFETASAAAQKAEAFAKLAQDAALSARAAEMKAEAASLKAEAARVKPLLEKPGAGDGEAIGRYLCFVKGDCIGGLPHLIAGAKPPLKTAAEKEALKPQEAAAQIELADLWWDLGQKEKSPWRKERIFARSKYWADLAAPSATGLLKVRLQKRLDDLEALQPGYVNLLKMADPAKDAVAGAWKLEDGKLQSPLGKFVRLEFPYQPPAEYDFKVVFTRLSGSNNVSQVLSRQGKGFLWIMELAQSRGAFGLCRGQWITQAANPSITELASSQDDPGPHTSLIEVRKDRVRVFFNGKLVRDWKTDYSDLSMNPDWKLRSEQVLGVACWESATEFQRVELTEISGKGKKLR